MNSPRQEFRLAILKSLGYAPEEIEPGKLHRFPTSDRRGDSAGWCKLFDDMRAGVFGCHRANVRLSWRASSPTPMTGQQHCDLNRRLAASAVTLGLRQRRQWEANAGHIARIWAQCVPLAYGDPCTQYLRRRGLGDMWPLPEVLRLHRALPYWHGMEKLGTFAAMVAPLVSPDGRVVALHRTYLSPDGQKAQVPSPKKLTFAAGPVSGACIPLQRPEHGCVGIAEGIETALAAWCASGLPTVAAYCASSLAAWRWPRGVQRLVIFADADEAGREAAAKLRKRALDAYLQCIVVAPTEPGADWADVWAARERVGVETGHQA